MNKELINDFVNSNKNKQENLYIPIYKHYNELRYRITYLIISLSFALITSYNYRLELLYLLSRPFLQLNQILQSTDVSEALSSIIKLCILSSLIVCFFYFLYQYWSFLVPSQYKFERIKTSLILLTILILVSLESLLIYFIIFPLICEIFSSFQVYVDNFDEKMNINDTYKIIEMSPRIGSILSSTIRIYIILSLLFQVPLVFVLLFSWNWINCFSICKNRKIVYFFLICFSSLISPPEFLSQIACLTLLSILFEFSLWLGCIFYLKNNIK